jgi:uncharacterized FAD-dependent dehydrogenase
MKLIFDSIELSPFEDAADLPGKLASRYHLPENTPFKILRKSLDARDKAAIVWRYRIEADVTDKDALGLLKMPGISIKTEPPVNIPARRLTSPLRAIIAGSGPAGLFCALRLIEAGAQVTIIERGRPVEERTMDIELLKRRGVLNEDSNVLFGEGGAGTYSDGKLTTRTRRPEIAWMFDRLVEMGAPEDIRSEQKPHLGTDRLRGIIRNIRKYILNSGSRIYFSEKAASLILHDSKAKGFITESGNEYLADAAVMATGHSARDTYEMLKNSGVSLIKKGFAIGLRAEHPSAIINHIQYGPVAGKGLLPAAEYLLTFNNKATGRGTYSFCMCPGGEVINSSSEPGMLCTNGMSFSKRNGSFSNAAIVVTIGPDDIKGDILAGINFQRSLEKAAFDAGGGGFYAPAQRITSFVAKKMDAGLPGSSFQPGIKPSDHSYLPEWIASEIRLALRHFEKRMRGFITEEALLIGVETRTSSPLRILRGDDMQSVSIPGLYPAGEGAGYAGGIVSSAVDGIRAADAILARGF